ncbi:uncharacterized protein LOC111694147 isoform X2 [Trichogramma pretiosum]|uniref:uncharacterized protein LOC111694147 isoform X2 n=1 Tax=Trichogramma pretiosum TaxID=7493 RepID=UPI000C71BB04|nr:uncharacterized protein LOC111694147 isoform X2 [Trichogramma pretiosum]
MSRPGDCKLKSLHDAVESKNLDLLESLLKGGVDPNAIDNDGMTALNFICSLTKLMKIDLKMIQLLIQYGADVNTQDEDGDSPMMNLFHDESNDMRVRIEALKILLKNGADVTHINNESETIFRDIILYNPANSDTAVALELLLKNGADPNTMVDKYDATALNFVCDEPKLTRVHLKMIQILLKYKADVNIQDKDGFSPIMNLFRCPENYKLRLKVFKLLLENQADVTLVDNNGYTILHHIFFNDVAKNPIIFEVIELLLKSGVDVNKQNEKGHSALHLAADHCEHVKIIDLLLKNSADPNKADNRGRTPLHFLCLQKNFTEVHLKMIQLLIQYKADVNVRDEDGWSPIIYSLYPTEDYKFENLKACKLLLENGVDVTLVDHEGNTVLHLIFQYNTLHPIILEAVELLLKSGFDVNVQNRNGNTALHVAVLWKNSDDPNIVDNCVSTPLHAICCRTELTEVHLKIIQLLIQYKADINIQNLCGLTPIMNLLNETKDCDSCLEVFKLLAKYHINDTSLDELGRQMLPKMFTSWIPISNIAKEVEFLLESGVNVNIRDKYGYSVLHNAVQDLKVEQVEFLLKNGADPNITDVNDISHCGGDGKTVLHSLIIGLSSSSSRYSLPYDEEKNHLERISKYVHQYVEILLKHGLDVNVKDRDGFTALNEAVSYCNYDIVKILLEHGADVNTVQFKGGFLEHKVPESLNLLTTLNVLAIIELWQSKGFQINNHQYLKVFKFLTLFEDSEMINDRHSLLRELWYKSNTLLINDLHWKDVFEFGSGSVIRKYVETIFLALNDNSKCIDFDIASLKKVLYNTIKKHLSLVEYGNMYMDIETHNYLRNTLNSLVSEIPEIVQQRTYKDIRDQVDLAKEMIISNNISYLDLCTSSPDKTYSLLQKCDYESAKNSANFRRNFDDTGKIGGIIRGYITKALVRRFLIKATTDSIKLMSHGILPDLCCDKIIKFLDVIDLVSVYEAVINYKF